MQGKYIRNKCKKLLYMKTVGVYYLLYFYILFKSQNIYNILKIKLIY